MAKKTKARPSSRVAFNRDRGLIALVVLVAAAVRFIYLAQIYDSPFFTVPQIDAKTYLDQARVIAAGQWLGEEAFWQPPLYPYLLGMAIKLLGVNPFALHLLHLMLGAVNCGLIALLGLRLFSRGPALVAGLIAAFYGPFIFFEGEYLTPVLSVFLNLCLFLLLLRARRRPSSRSSAGLGALFGLSAITRPDVLAFLPLALAWLYWAWRKDFTHKDLAKRFLLILAMIAAMIAPVTLHNAYVSREFVPISTNSGANFYIGNNSRWQETLAIRPTMAWGDLMAEPYRQGYPSPAQRSAYFMGKAWADIKSAPGAELTRLIIKSLQFFAGYEYPRNVDIYAYRDFSSLFWLLFWKRGIAFPFGLIAPLALAGFLVFLDRRTPETVLLVAYFIAYVAATALFFVAARYRIPAIPALILFAANLPFWLAAKIRERKLAPAIAAGAIGCCSLWLCNRGLAQAPVPPAGEIHMFLGHADSDLRKLPEAVSEFHQAIALNPEIPDSYLRLGVVYGRMNDPQAAAESFQRALAISKPQSLAAAWACYFLGDLARDNGDATAARKWFEQSLQAFPFQFNSRLALASLMIKGGDQAGAKQELLTLIRQYPRSPEPYRELARMDAAQGRLAEAIELMEKAVSFRSFDPKLLLELAKLYSRAGQYQSAQSALRRAKRLQRQD